MSYEKVFLKDWRIEGDRVKLEYSDNDKVYITKKDFDRAFGAIVNATKEEVIRDFGIA